MRGEGGGVAGSQAISTAVYTGAQINFGDLTSYLTYGQVPFKRFRLINYCHTVQPHCYTLRHQRDNYNKFVI
jgi:hypothetical protein